MYSIRFSFHVCCLMGRVIISLRLFEQLESPQWNSSCHRISGKTPPVEQCSITLVFMVVSLRFSDIQGFWTICFNTTKQFETFHVTSQFPNEIPWVLWFVSRTMFGTNLWWSWCRFGRCYGQTPCTRGGANRLEKGGMIGGSHIGCYMAT